MASENVKEVTDATFEAEVLKAEVPTLVDFWAVWCGPCKQIAPTVDALATEYKGRIKVAKMAPRSRSKMRSRMSSFAVMTTSYPNPRATSVGDAGCAPGD